MSFILVSTLVLSVVIYIIIYDFLEISVAFKSYCLFMINYLIVISFCATIYSLKFYPLISPIYISDITKISVYRYILLILMSITGLSFYALYKYLNITTSSQMFFDIRQEISRILESFSQIEALYLLIFNFLRKTTKNIKIYIFIQFITIYLINIIQTVLLLNFTFLQGDLRWNIYLIPVSFLAWISRNLYYWFQNKLERNYNYLNKLLLVTYRNNANTNTSDYILGTKTDLEFKLTSSAIAEGYNDNSIHILSNLWMQYGHIYSCLSMHEEKFLFYIKKIIFCLRLFCWNSIVYYYYFVTNDVLFSKWPLFSNIFRRANTANVSHGRSYASEAWSIHKQYQQDLEKESEGAYKSGHFAKVDVAITDEKNRVLFEGGATHGAGSAQNPSYKEHPTRDFKGPNPKGQSTTPAKPDTFIPRHFLNKPIPNSRALYNEPVAKENTAKNTTVTWEEKNT